MRHRKYKGKGITSSGKQLHLLSFYLRYKESLHLLNYKLFNKEYFSRKLYDQRLLKNNVQVIMLNYTWYGQITFF